MAVAAAIGVGADDDLDDGFDGGMDGGRGHNARLGRLKAQQMSFVGASYPANHGSNAAVMGDINRSIEKMSLHCGVAAASGAEAGTTVINNRNVPQSNALRRDSNWTNSTEGYGSMRSSSNNNSAMLSRRCSELSAVSSHCSNFSTTAVRNAPWPNGGGSGPDCSSAMSTCSSSRRSSLTGHLSRLQQKAAAAASPVPPIPPPPSYGQHHQYQQQQQQQMQQQQQQQQTTTRRASDPVRRMDGNFGVGGQMSRHRSFTDLSGGQQQQRVPIHGQAVHGLPNHGQHGMATNGNQVGQNILAIHSKATQR